MEAFPLETVARDGIFQMLVLDFHRVLWQFYVMFTESDDF